MKDILTISTYTLANIVNDTGTTILPASAGAGEGRRMYNFILKTKGRGTKTPDSSRYEAMDKYDSHLKGTAFSSKTARILLMSVGTMGLAVGLAGTTIRTVCQGQPQPDMSKKIRPPVSGALSRVHGLLLC